MSDDEGKGASYTVRELVMMVGLAISLVGLGGTVVAGGIWVGRIDERVATLTRSTVTDGRISALETEVKNLNGNTKDMQRDVRQLLIELRRSP